MASRPRIVGLVRISVLAVGWIAVATGVLAQELSPRAYWPAPRGTKVGILGFSYSAGDILTDPSLPVTGVDSIIRVGIAGYFGTFSLWGRSANVVAEVPYLWGTVEGEAFGQHVTRELSGVGDIGLTLAVNLLGAPTMTREEFAALLAAPRPILGASLKVVAPTGAYETGRLVNVGANRWAVKPELGYIWSFRPRWLLELEAGVWLFGDDDDFVVGRREQDPIWAGEVHLVKVFRQGPWLSLEANFFTGGQSTIGGERRADLQRNSRVGATLVFPTGRGWSVKAGYSSGVVTETGSDFDQVLVAVQSTLGRGRQRGGG